MNKANLDFLVNDIFESMRRDNLEFSDAVDLAVNALAEKVNTASDVLLCKIREGLDYLRRDIIALVKLQDSLKNHGFKKIELTDGAYTFSAWNSVTAKGLIAQALEYERDIISARLMLLINIEEEIE